jgi:hypothetical protein
MMESLRQKSDVVVEGYLTAHATGDDWRRQKVFPFALCLAV